MRKRKYLRDGTTIYCHRVTYNEDKGEIEIEEVDPGLMYKFTVPSEQAGKDLMEDVNNGER